MSYFDFSGILFFRVTISSSGIFNGPVNRDVPNELGNFPQRFAAVVEREELTSSCSNYRKVYGKAW